MSQSREGGFGSVGAGSDGSGMSNAALQPMG